MAEDKKICNNNVSSCSAYMIWRNYAIGTSVVSLSPLIGYWVNAEVMSIILLGVSLCLFAFVGHNRRSSDESCVIVPYIVARVILVFIFLMVVGVLLARNNRIKEFETASRLLSHSLILFLAPLMALGAYIMRQRNMKNTLCADCLLRNGTPYERSLLGHIYYQENKYIVPRLFRVYLVMTVSLWGYFLLWQNRNDMTDAIFFVIFPACVLIIDLILLKIHYMAASVYYDKRQEQEKFPYDGQFRLIRILIISHTGIYFVSDESGMNDSPFSFYSPFSEKIGYGEAFEYVSSILNCPADIKSLRFCYGSMDIKNRRSVEHFMYFVDSDSELFAYENRNLKKGKWWTKNELEQNFNAAFSRMACTELHRIYTVLYMSKLYYADGRKKTNVKGYTPTLTIADLRNSDVDFSDNRWMLLSKFNKDTAFLVLKRVWYKYIEGLN